MVPKMWTKDEVINTIHCREAELNFEKVDVDLIDPGRCHADVSWDTWQIAFINKLVNATTGVAKVPVAYIVRPTNVKSDFEIEDNEERQMYQR